jgi:hypothetical protein
MLENEKAVLLVIGAVFFLIGLLGGGLEVSAVKIPTISRYTRITSLVVGAVLLVLALYRIMFPSIPATPQTPPEPAPSPTQTATSGPVDPTATSTPESPTIAPPTSTAPSNTIFFDDFETIPGVWNVGDASNESITEKITITNGKYMWEITAAQPAFRSEYPEAPIVSDFELQADMRLVSGLENASYGLAFRATLKGEYAFHITNQGYFMLGYRNGETGEWTDSISWSAESAIKPNSSNLLKVVAKGSSIQLFINGKQVGSITDSNASNGKTGISLALYQAADQAALEMDNYSLSGLQE